MESKPAPPPLPLFRYVFVIPIVTFVIIIGTMFLCYGIAVSNDHVNRIWPFISDTGALPPESCIFGLLLNIGSMWTAFCIYLRHKEILELYDLAPKRFLWLRVVNYFLTFFGCLAAFGVMIVANFQENRWLRIHLIGAFMAFGIGIFYAWCQTIVSIFMRVWILCPIWMIVIRALLCLMSTISFGTMEHCAGLAHANETSLPFKINSTDPGYDKFICATASEWVLVIGFILYFLTFTFEFRYFHLIPPKLLLNLPAHIYPRETRRSNDPFPKTYMSAGLQSLFNQRGCVAPEFPPGLGEGYASTGETERINDDHGNNRGHNHRGQYV